MNIMRKLLVGQPRPVPEDQQQHAQHTALGLMHLKKLFGEYSHPQTALTQKEQEDKLYNMLPLFCKVFGNCPARDMTEKFENILAFCQQVSKLMVSEIRRRASNQSTEAASWAIVKFLEIESTEESSNGWMLLSAINLLASGDVSLIEVMTAASLPSTLVKCLYLFFDLPELQNADLQETNCEFTAHERRILLQKVFVQMLVRLCSHLAPAEELARKDDLTLLFSAITSWCPLHNVPWRKSAGEVLMTLSRHGLSQTVVSYIHSKGCIALCTDNMQRVQELSPLEIMEMFVTVFCFLKDSSEVSQTLLDDFRSCQGYMFLSEFLLRLEQDESEEAREALRNLIFLVATLTTCGFIELKPSQASMGSLFQIPGFQLPSPLGRGVSVRNIQAFQVLQTVFLKASSVYLCNIVLDAISGIYHSDSTNYFILEAQHTLSQFAEKIHAKSPDIQEKFFKLLEFIVFELKFVPCKELISLSIMLKAQSSVECSITCMDTLLSILKYNTVFKDVYREVGLLEVMVTCLHRFAALLKEPQTNVEESDDSVDIPDNAQKLGFLVMEGLTLLLSNSSSNASVFRECGGARCAHNMVPCIKCRHQALGIVQQLVLCNGGDDDMGTLLAMMHTAPVIALELKTDILKSLLFVLRESHRTRTVFRKVGGFVYVMSVLVSMEGCLADPPKSPWDSVDQKQVVTILKTVFTTLTVAMRYEPANAKFFSQEICYTSLTDTIRLLGCFSESTKLKSMEDNFLPTEEETFHMLFTGNKDSNIENEVVPRRLITATMTLRLLYDMALDAFDRVGGNTSLSSPALKRTQSDANKHCRLSPNVGKKPTVTMLNLIPPTPEPIIVYPGAVTGILHLLPAIELEMEKQMALTLQLYTAEILRSLMRSERNQQVMCEVGLPGELLTYCAVALDDEMNFLHGPLQYMFERLAAQALEPKDLRDFLRLGNPLCCKPFNDVEEDSSHDSHPRKEGGPVQLTRVKTLISMTTPRDFRMNGAALMPPFVEFEMNSEGFGCLFLPSIAPQSVSGPSVVGVGMVSGGNDSSVVGGIGTGDRIFPPQTGLTCSTWICVEKFSDPRQDPHSVRLITLVRHLQGRDDHLICLSVLLSSRDKALIISSQETAFPQSGPADWEPEPSSDGCIRVWCPELLQEGQWHHIVLVLNRAVLKNSSATVYVDGRHVCTQKLHYISQNPGGGAANLTVAASVFGYVGTPPSWRRHSRLVWKQGPCLLLEDMLTAHVVELLYQLGPSYLGCLQAPTIYGSDVLGALIAEEKVILGINALAISQLTLARIRKVYSKIDSKAVAKQLGMSSHENATPIRVLHNSAGHLSGPARSLGGILIGYQGVRTFCPKPVAKVVENVGGCPVLLGLIAMAADVEGLYAAVKALACVVRSNMSAQQEMDRIRGYQTLAMLLKKKRALLNSHILHLAFSLVGTVDSSRENTVIPNPIAFQDLLGDLEVWHEAPAELQRSLYEHFYELVTESSDQKNNLRIMRNLGMVSKLLHVLREPSLPPSISQIIHNLLTVLLHNTPNSQDLLRFGQFIAATLPTCVVSEKQINLQGIDRKSNCEEDSSHIVSTQNILLRNRLINLLYTIMFTQRKFNYAFAEEIIRVLGFDWLLLFVQGHLHHSTVILSLKILSLCLTSPNLMQRFREGSSNGGWLRDTEPVVENRMGVVLGFNVGMAKTKASGPREIHEEAYQVPGFQMLQWLMPKHILIPEVYFYLLSILLNRPLRCLPTIVQFDLDSIWTYVFGVPASQSALAVASKMEICPDMVVVLLAMIRTMLNQFSAATTTPSVSEYPVILIQFLLFLYHNTPEFLPICMSGDILCGLASTLFPYPVSETGSETSSPTEEIKSCSLDSIVLVKTSDKHEQLTNHPARKFIMDFLRVIIMDSLSMPMPTKSPPVIDLLLEAMPVHANRSQQRNFQTEILSSLMDHLLAADILLGEQSALPIASGGSYSNIAGSVFYLAGRIVDKLWQGIILRDSHEVFDFIIKLISQAKRKSVTFSLDAIYRCLNRTILYQLSRPIDSIADQTSVLEALHKLTSNRALILGPGNCEPEFIGCLCYCLLQLTEEITVGCDSNRRTVWHVNPTNSPRTMAAAQEGQNLLVTAAKRVWKELYVCKKPAIEEVFKVTIPSQNKTPDLQAVRDHINEAASRMWLAYLESEKRCNNKVPSEFHSQFQSKIQKVTGGLSRLASRKSRKEESVRIRWANISLQEVSMWTFTHIAIVRDLMELQSKQLQQSHQHMQKYLFEEWIQTENEVTRERGLWGPMVKSRLDKWMLDMTEGPCRMRKKMMKNEWFYIHYPYRPEIDSSDNKALKYKVASSYDSKEHYLQYRSINLVERECNMYEVALMEEVPTDSEPSEETVGQIFRTPLLPRVNRMVSEIDDDADSFDTDMNPDSDEEDKPDNQTLLRLLEEGEKINFMFRCARIQGLDTNEGLLLFGKEHYYVVDGFTLLKSREIRDIDFLPPSMYEPIIPNTSYQIKRGQKKMCSKFAYDDIREVHKRRYLLQPIALEVFSADGRNFLLVFPREMRKKVYQRFLSVATGINDNAQQSVAGQKRSANVEQGAGILSNLIGETSVTQRWVRGEINNFQYLMHLNTLAGRSYNDLMQYPVFPWILANYDDEELRLNDPATFRDFSKPMGAQSPERLKQFQKRYREWDDPHGETPPYHYGTHYSSAMIVASYLVRMEPFTQHFLKLQGGHFDLADRMFHSVKEAWLSASKHNMADVKELIPEFFYLSEMFVNANNFDLGCKQNGVFLGDVILPNWAKGDPREFIRVHRLALECDYVSAHLHEWIDLIFGFKQQGQAALEAVNVFHHLFYEGNVDIYNIDDPLKKNATIGFINNFGQIPKQLFKKAHPAKKLNQRIGVIDASTIPFGLNYSPDKLFFHNLDNLKPTMQPIKELKGPVGQIISNEKNVMAVEQNKILIPKSGTRYVAWGFGDHSLRIGNYQSDKASFVCELSQCGEIMCCACPNSKLVITGGTSCVINVWEIGKKQLILRQNLYGHTEAVTCLAASPAYNLIVSGSRDHTSIIWDMSRLIFVKQLTSQAAPIAAVAINELTGDIATCAGTYLYLWTINGDPIASVNISTGRTDRTQQILCVAFSQLYEWDPLNVVMTGSSDGIVRMWSADFVQVPIEDKLDDNKSEKSSKELKTESSEDNLSIESDSRDLLSTQSKADDYVRKMSVVTSQTEESYCRINLSSSTGNLAKSGSESSLSDEENADQENEASPSCESKKGHSPISERLTGLKKGKRTGRNSSESLNISNNNNKSDCSIDVVASSSSCSDIIRRKHINGITASNHIHRSSTISTGDPVTQEKAGTLRASKSDTSLTDSFVFVSESEVSETEKTETKQPLGPAPGKKGLNKLREGFQWKCQLIFRSKLTMHTAFDRKDNSEPAAVTTIAVSKDHKSVYVGDGRGRVFCWSVTDHPGRVIADHWVKDEGGDSCNACGTKFTFSERRHHCRNCGQLFCSKCSRFESEINRLRIRKPVRVCQACYNSLRPPQGSPDNTGAS